MSVCITVEQAPFCNSHFGGITTNHQTESEGACQTTLDYMSIELLHVQAYRHCVNISPFSLSGLIQALNRSCATALLPRNKQAVTTTTSLACSICSIDFSDRERGRETTTEREHNYSSYALMLWKLPPTRRGGSTGPTNQPSHQPINLAAN